MRMPYYALWLDHQKAMLCGYAPQKVATGIFKAEERPRHHNHNPRDVKDKGHERFYHQLAQALDGVQGIVLIGPGEAKREFRHYLEQRHPALGRNVLAMLPLGQRPSWPLIQSLASPLILPLVREASQEGALSC